VHGGGAEWVAAAIVAAIACRSEGLLLPLAAGVAAVALLRAT
jgi:uncharacterized membrane protein